MGLKFPANFGGSQKQIWNDQEDIISSEASKRLFISPNLLRHLTKAQKTADQRTEKNYQDLQNLGEG